MRFKWTLLVLMIGLMGTAPVAKGAVRDSLRLEIEAGLRYVIHRVDAGETVFGLARRYGVAQADLLKANPELAQAGLKVNQTIRVPIGKATQTASPAVQDVHTVAPGETLFGISQKYDVSVADLRSWNGLTSNDLSIGQELVVRGRGPAAQPETTATQTPAAGESKQYTVQPGETLFALSRKFNVTVADLRIWNKLPDNTLSVGQTLWVVAPPAGGGHASTTPQVQEPSTTTSQPVANTPTPPSNPTTAQSTQNTNPTPNNSGSTGTTPTPEPETSIPTRVSESVRNLGQEEDEENSTGFRKVREKGMCEVITGSGDNNKYLAMHATAPIGTIMEVRNEMNDLKVFVRVVARLPQTSSNERLVLKISQAAYERLGAADRRFPIEVTYIP